jgi:L-ribulokinase
MTALKDKRFTPDPDARAVYEELYAIYRELHDAFGAVPGARGDLGTVMKRLLAIKDRAARHVARNVARDFSPASGTDA